MIFFLIRQIYLKSLTYNSTDSLFMCSSVLLIFVFVFMLQL